MYCHFFQRNSAVIRPTYKLCDFGTIHLAGIGDVYSYRVLA